MPRDRARLSKVRHHLREALGNLPDGDRDIKHWRPLLTTMVASVDEMIGPEDEPEQVADADSSDGWHGHEAERQLAIGRIAGEDAPVEADPVLPAWATPSGKAHRRGEC